MPKLTDIRKFLAEEDGPTTVEYAFLLALILELLAQGFEGLDRLLQRRVGAARLDHVARVEPLDLQRRREPGVLRCVLQAVLRERERRRPLRRLDARDTQAARRRLQCQQGRRACATPPIRPSSPQTWP